MLSKQCVSVSNSVVRLYERKSEIHSIPCSFNLQLKKERKQSVTIKTVIDINAHVLNIVVKYI